MNFMMIVKEVIVMICEIDNIYINKNFLIEIYFLN